jgi:hypothetical protein
MQSIRAIVLVLAGGWIAGCGDRSAPPSPGLRQTPVSIPVDNKKVPEPTDKKAVGGTQGDQGTTAPAAPDKRISIENFEKIELGMTRAQVHELLGPPTGRQNHSDRQGATDYWMAGKLQITVHFKNNKVVKSGSVEKE